MFEKTEYEKTVSKLSEHINTSFTINSDGTINAAEPSFDLAGINDYIVMLIAREAETAKRYFREGEIKGYYEGQKSVPQPLYGDFAFTNGEQKFLVMARGDYVEAAEVKNGNNCLMAEIPKANLYE